MMKTIALLGYFGVGNLGDEAIVSTLVKNIRLRQPGVRILGISLNPEDTRRRHGIEALPIRRRYAPRLRQSHVPGLSTLLSIFTALFLKLPAEAAHALTSFRALLGIDAVVVAGSGGVYDWWHGAWTHPFTHFRWALLCRLTGTKLVYMSVGAGPFKTRLGRWFFRFALQSASYRSVRDEGSLEWLREIGVDKSVSVYPDMAFDIILEQEEEAASHAAPRPHQQQARRVGINPLPFYHEQWSALVNRGGIGYAGYISAMAEFVDWLLRRGCHPVFFHSQIGDGFLDADIAEAVDSRQKSGAWRACAHFADCRTEEELIGEISQLDIVVASRFHAILFSYLLRKPVLGISYHHKTEDLMRRMEQSAYTVDIQTLSFDTLSAAFRTLEHELDTCRWSLSEDTFRRYRRSLDAQFDAVFSDHASEYI